MGVHSAGEVCYLRLPCLMKALAWQMCLAAERCCVLELMSLSRVLCKGVP